MEQVQTVELFALPVSRCSGIPAILKSFEFSVVFYMTEYNGIGGKFSYYHLKTMRVK